VVRVETFSASVVGRLVDLDVRSGVTLEPWRPVVRDERKAGSADHAAPVGPPSDLRSGRELPFESQSGGRIGTKLVEDGPERGRSSLVKLALTDIRSIEPFDSRDSPCGSDPDS
jgi:hypothetical protein